MYLRLFSTDKRRFKFKDALQLQESFVMEGFVGLSKGERKHRRGVVQGVTLCL